MKCCKTGRERCGGFSGSVVNEKSLHLWRKVEAIVSVLGDVNIPCPYRNLVLCPFPAGG